MGARRRRAEQGERGGASDTRRLAPPSSRPPSSAASRKARHMEKPRRGCRSPNGSVDPRPGTPGRRRPPREARGRRLARRPAGTPIPRERTNVVACSAPLLVEYGAIGGERPEGIVSRTAGMLFVHRAGRRSKMLNTASRVVVYGGLGL